MCYYDHATSLALNLDQHNNAQNLSGYQLEAEMSCPSDKAIQMTLVTRISEVWRKALGRLKSRRKSPLQMHFVEEKQEF